MPSAEHEQWVAMMTGAAAGTVQPSLAERRASMEAVFGSLPIGPDISVNCVDANGVPVEVVHSAGGRSDRVLLYLHGGGYALGSARCSREFAARLARASGMDIYLADYRLAPEHPFPAAVDDALAVYRHIIQRGTAPESIAIGGESAGGGLAFATLLGIKQMAEKWPLPACAFGLSPWVDLELTGASAQPGILDDAMARIEDIREMAQWYAGNRLRDPLVSPLHGDLQGLPPMLLQVGTRELLLDDATRFASRAWSAGVDVDLQVFAGLTHVWQVVPHLPEAQRAVAAISDFLRLRVR